LRIKIDDYSPWISSELDKTLRPTRSKASKLMDDAARSLNDARSFYDGLARKGERDMASKKDAASYRAARVINHAGQEAAAQLKEIQIPDEANWESLKILKDGFSHASRSIRTLRDTTSRELSGFYLLDQRSFSGSLDRIAKSAERLSAFLEGEGASLQRTKTMSGIVDSIATARRELKEKLDETQTLTRERDQIQASAQELAGKLDDVTSKGDLHEVLEIERELRKESRAFRSETLAHLKRPLRRLGDLSQRGDFPMGSDEREALSKFVVSPYKTFLSNSTGQYVSRLMENMKKAIDSGKMEFKPKKTARVSAQLSQLIGTSHLAEKQEKGRRLVARRRELLHKQDVKEMYEYRKGLLLKIEETRKQEQEVEERMRSVASMTDALNKRLAELLRLAETKTREYVGQDVQLESV
jgi:hypothetical protein